MNRHDPEFSALVDRIAAGQITREDAAAAAGVPINTFKTWLRRAGALGGLKHTRRSAGVYHFAAEKDPAKVAAYVEAVAECTREHNPPSVRSVAKRYAARGVSYPWLLHKVQQARAGSATLAPPTTSVTKQIEPA
jgi:transposase